MSPEIDVYVSYARADDEVVAPFVDDLHSRLRLYVGHELTLWIDRSNISAGANWQDALRQAVAGARSMLAIVSPSYLRSEWAKREYQTFALSGRPIVPVAEEIGVRELFPRQHHWLYCRFPSSVVREVVQPWPVSLDSICRPIPIT